MIISDFSRYSTWIGSVVTFLFFVFCVSLSTTPIASATEILDVHFDEPGGACIKLESLVNRPPPRGFVPIRASIKNHTLQETKWTIQSYSLNKQSASVTDARSINNILVPANEKRSVELLIPVATFSESVAFDVKSPRALPTIRPFSFPSDHVREPQIVHPLAIAFDASLPRGALTPHFILNPSLFSEDWRAYSGFDTLVIAASTWTQLEDAQRVALKYWCSLGGSLVLVIPADFGNNLLPQAGPFGFGQISFSGMQEYITRQFSNNRTDGTDWSVGKAVPREKKTNRNILWVSLLGVTFATLIGPVNLFVLASARKKNRLFWTTLLISVGTSLLLLSTIIMRQGIGSQGSRMLLAFQIPEEGVAAIWQEQTSHTGLLVRQNFRSPLPLLLFPSPLPPFSYTLKNGNEWTGDWFRPSSMQSQILATIYPSIHNISLIPGNMSTRPCFVGEPDPDVKSGFYIRPDGSIWSWNGTMFVASSYGNLEEWLNKIAQELSPVLRTRLNQIRGELHTFPNWKNGLILVKHTGLTAIPTLSSIRWKDVPALLITPPTVPKK